jgi:hypothetical protein
MPELGLNGKQKVQLASELVDAFSRNDLDRLLVSTFDKSLDQLSAPGTVQDQFFEVVQAVEKRGWTAQLLEGVRAQVPERVAIQRFASELGAGPIGTFGLERLVDVERGTRDFGTLFSALGAMERRVCRVDVAGQPQGTGFLVGPDVVMTNFHVVERAINESLTGRSIKAIFGFKTMPDGRAVDPGTAISATKDHWLLASSHYSPIDEKPYDPAETPTTEFLDYALIVLSEEDRRKDPFVDNRSFYRLDEVGPEPAPDAYLFIAQHAGGRQLQYDDARKAVIGGNDAHTRIRYRVNTEPGSSGSPCFDHDLRLVALHHSGDPNFEKLHQAEYNEGIPLETIASSLSPDVRSRLSS